MSTEPKPGAQEADEDYATLGGVLAWMRRHANKRGYVLATVSTMFASWRGRYGGYGSGPHSVQAFRQECVAPLEAIGCIEIEKIWDDGPHAREHSQAEPEKFIQLIRLTKRDLTPELWGQYKARKAKERERARVRELKDELRLLQTKPQA